MNTNEHECGAGANVGSTRLTDKSEKTKYLRRFCRLPGWVLELWLWRYSRGVCSVVELSGMCGMAGLFWWNVVDLGLQGRGYKGLKRIKSMTCEGNVEFGRA